MMPSVSNWFYADVSDVEYYVMVCVVYNNHRQQYLSGPTWGKGGKLSKTPDASGEGRVIGAFITGQGVVNIHKGIWGEIPIPCHYLRSSTWNLSPT